MSSESDFLSWIKQQQQATRFVPVPAGDDLAVLRWPADDLLLVGVDQVLDGVHFDSAIHGPGAIGRKVMNRNLSDCAAMGCLPAAAVISAALPMGAGLDYARELYVGVREAASVFGCSIVGGDTGTWSGRLAVSVTILGRAAGVQPVTRSGARPGDGVYVTGRLGGSILGRHMASSPRIAEGRALAASGFVTAMIDLSDGLSRDLPRIAAGAIVEETSIPIHDDARIRRSDNRSDVEHALHDGEDYELLFTASSQLTESCSGLGLRIGTVTAEAGIRLRKADGSIEPLTPLGWEHGL